MKKVIFSAIIFCFMFSGYCQAAEKVAYVDLSRIFTEYQKTKSYDEDLSGKEEKYTKEREKKVDDIKKDQDKLNLLSDKQQESKKAELDEKLKSLQEFDRQNQMDLRKEQDEKMKDIFKDIEEAVKKISEKEGYTLVFNDRVLVYQAKQLDITDQVIAALNSKKQ